MKKSANLTLAISLLIHVASSINWVEPLAQNKQISGKIPSAREVARNTLPSVVFVLASGEKESIGSGFFIDHDLVVTNYHVIQRAHEIFIFKLGEEKAYSAKIIAIDRQNDIAIVRVANIYGKPLSLASRIKLEVGDVVYAIGNPRGLEGTFSNGIVSNIRDNGDIQITAPISPGSSGGPILNEKGEVIGIATYYVTGGQNLNFAKPSEHLLALFRSIRQEKISSNNKKPDSTSHSPTTRTSPNPIIPTLPNPTDLVGLSQEVYNERINQIYNDYKESDLDSMNKTVAKLEELVKADSSKPGAFEMLGIIYISQNNGLEKAQRAMEQAIKLDGAAVIEVSFDSQWRQMTKQRFGVFGWEDARQGWIRIRKGQLQILDSNNRWLVIANKSRIKALSKKQTGLHFLVTITVEESNKQIVFEPGRGIDYEADLIINLIQKYILSDGN